VQVAGLPLSLGSVDYYQVYFSVLAALGPRDASYCPKALSIIDEIRLTGYEQQRPDITTNITAAELECSGAGPALLAPVETATPGTPEPIFTSTPFPTETPVQAPTP